MVTECRQLPYATGHPERIEDLSPIGLVALMDGQMVVVARRDGGKTALQPGMQMLIASEPEPIYDPEDGGRTYLGCTQIVNGIATLQQIRQNVLVLYLEGWGYHDFRDGMWVQFAKAD